MKYDFDKEVERLNTHSYKWDLLGEEYLPLWVADMDFEVSPAVTKRLEERIKHPFYGYFLTGNEIYDVLKEWFINEYAATVAKDWIKIIPGIVPALSTASCMYNGSSMTNIPNYCCLLDAPVNAGNTLIKVPLANEDERYSIDFDALEAAITDDTRLFYLCNPHNPVGRVYSLDELKKVSEFAQKHGLIVISDEAHCECVYEGKHIPFFTVDEYAKNHSVCFYSNGKMYNVPDLILAFAVIPNPSVRAEFERVSFALGEEHALNVEVGIATYRDSVEWRQELLEYLRANRDYLESELKSRFPLAKLVHLEGTYLQWVDFRAYGKEIDAKFFKDRAKVFMTDGDSFGGEGYVRINFGTRKAIIKEALDRMEAALFKYLSRSEK